MNKKLFLGMFAAAGMLLATSCSNDELDVVQSGNEAQVSFSLGLEGGIATRAISDGESADVLMYAVFDEEGNRINTIQKVSRTGVTFPTTENITLAKGQTYKVAFWAQDEDCEAYTVSDDMKVTVNYANDKNKGNNDETRDAFFKTVEFTVTGSTSIDVELKRPFAQINVGVTKADWDAAVASGITVAKSSVVIKNAATELNLLDGTVSGETEVSYELANIPSEPAILQVDADGNGIKEDYNWLSMSYILPSAAPTGYEKAALENVAFVFASNGEPIEFNQGLNNVPVQRNWRTNIVGKILTGDITFNIVIDEEFEDDHNVELPYATIGDVVYKSFAEAMAAVQDGETIKLEGETTLDGVADSNLFTIEGKSITIDLNGYGFVATVPDVTKNSSIFYVAKNSGLTIVGEGNVKVTTNKAPNVLAAFINNDGGTVNLKGGNWTMTALELPKEALIPTFVDNNSNVNSATLNIYDGTYTFHRNLFRNFANAAGHNNYATVATINIYGGTFNGRESDAGAIWNQKPSTTTPNGAGIINVMGGTFNNVNITDDFSGVVYVNNQEELNNALANVNTHTVMLGAGKYVPSLYNNDIPARKSLTIIGSEGTQF
ncbi:MAG TPA: FimB/Mfa2 family fimbrial subunit, partial [Candidatus Alistipes merdigallinarum]|nr:FimB/Mfa2 family fimbrial subunit [Candidatus Alistipes merdigallinarum]